MESETPIQGLRLEDLPVRRFGARFASREIEEKFRQEALVEDLESARFLFLFVALSAVMHLIIEWRLQRDNPLFLILTGTRFVILASTAAIFLRLRHGITPQALDRWLLAWLALVLPMAFYSLSIRPPNRMMLAMSVLAIVVVSILIPMRFSFQAWTSTIFALAVMVLLTGKNPDSFMLFVNLTALTLAMIVGLVSSARLHRNRRGAFAAGFLQLETIGRLEAALAETVQTRLALGEARRELEQRVRERTAELHLANDSLRSLSGRLLQLQDEERRRLARDLHDSLGQLIAAVGMNLGAIRKQEGKMDSSEVRALTEISELVEEMSRQIRTISHLLHPPLLDEVGLESALRWYVEEFSKRSGINVDLQISDSFGRLLGDLEITIFRIAQECLTNIHRHSGSTSALIRITRSNQEIVVQVQDKGRGISAEKLIELESAKLTGVGFRGMRERVGQLGGTWHVHSDTHGTIVIARLPSRESFIAEVS